MLKKLDSLILCLLSYLKPICDKIAPSYKKFVLPYQKTLTKLFFAKTAFFLKLSAKEKKKILEQNLLGKIMETGKAIYAFTSFDANTPMLYLDIDRDKAEAMHVPISSIFSTLQSQLGSVYINDFNKYGKTYKVKMQSSGDFRRNLNIVSQLYVPSATGALVPLDTLATIKWTLGPRQTERFNMFPAANVNTQGKQFVSSGELMDIVQDIVSITFTDISPDARASSFPSL